MEGKKRRFKIVSQGEDLPEAVPGVGDVVRLCIRIASSGNIQEESTVELGANSVRPLGSRYVRIAGPMHLMGEDHVWAVATYEHGQRYQSGVLIGELVVYWD